MRKLFTLLMLMVAIGVSVNAQVFTLRATAAMLTEDFTWEDNEPTDVNMLIIYDRDKDIMKIDNKSQSKYFLKEVQQINGEPDEDGDVIIELRHESWDHNGVETLVKLFYYDANYQLDEHDIVIRIYYNNVWLEYGCDLLDIRDTSVES